MTDPDPSLTKRGSAIVATRWSATGGAILQGSRFTITAVLAAILLPEELGIVAMAHVVLGLLNLVMDLGTGQAIIRQEKLSRNLLNSIFFLNIGTGLVIAGGMYLGSDLIASIFDTPDLAPVLQALSLVVLIGSFANAPRGLLSRNLLFGRIASSDIAGALIYGAVAIPLALAGQGVWSVVAGLVASVAAATTMIWVLSNWKPGWHMSLTDLREISSFSGNLTAANISQNFLNNLDSIIISRGLGEAAMGYYYIAQRLIVTPRILLTAQFSAILVPALARVQNDLARFRRDFLRSCHGFALVSLPLMAGIGIVADPFVRGILGEDKLPAATVTALLAAIACIMSPEATANTIYRVRGRTDLMFRWGIVRGLAIASAYWVGAQWGLEGLVLAFGVAAVLLMFPSMFIPLRLIDLPISQVFSAIRPYAIGAGLMTGIALAARFALEQMGVQPIPVLLATAVIGTVVYIAYIWISKPPALDDLYRVLARRRTAPTENVPGS